MSMSNNSCESNECEHSTRAGYFMLVSGRGVAYRRSYNVRMTRPMSWLLRELLLSLDFKNGVLEIGDAERFKDLQKHCRPEAIIDAVDRLGLNYDDFPPIEVRKAKAHIIKITKNQYAPNRQTRGGIL